MQVPGLFLIPPNGFEEFSHKIVILWIFSSGFSSYCDEASEGARGFRFSEPEGFSISCRSLRLEEIDGLRAGGPSTGPTACDC